MTFRSVLRCFLSSLILLMCFTAIASAQDTTGVIRISSGIPTGLRRIAVTQMDPAFQKKAMSLATQYDYRQNRDWDDTVKYWSDGRNLRAVSFINSSYEFTTVVFSQKGKWLQTTTYPNPEFKETSQALSALEEKGYSVQGLSSPIGAIIKYRTPRDTWYEATAYKSAVPQTMLRIALDRKFKFIGLRNWSQ